MQGDQQSIQNKWNALFMEILSSFQSTVLLNDIEKKSVFPAMIKDDPQEVEVLANEIRKFLFTYKKTEIEELSALPVDHLIILAESLGSHLAKQKDFKNYEYITYMINAITIHWLHNFLRLPRTTKGYYRASKHRARLLLIKMALIRQFPTYPTEGSYSFGNKLPLLYASHNWPWLDDIRSEMGLPSAAVKTFKDSDHLSVLLKEVSKDSYQPFMIIGSTGTFRYDFEGDNIPKLLEIADQNKLWFHVEGSVIFSLAATIPLSDSAQSVKNSILQADSILFNALSLFGYFDENKSIPTVFYRQDKNTQQTSSSSSLQLIIPNTPAPVMNTANKNINKINGHNKNIPPDHGLLTISLWFGFQYIGREKLRQRINKSIILCTKLYGLLKSSPYLTILTSPESLMVIFQYVPLSNKKLNQSQEIFPPEFIEKVNQQILQDVVNSTTAIQLDLTLVPASDYKYSDHISFNPLFSANVENINLNIIESFVSNLNLEIELIDATLKYKNLFKQLIWSHSSKGLYLVDVPNFVGLGAVRYIPPIISTGHAPIMVSEHSLPLLPTGISPKLQEDIDRLNGLISTKLIQKSEKSIFQESKDIDGHSCILLGVDTKPIVEECCLEYINDIISTAIIVEQEFDFSKEMGKIIERGIKEAEARIRRENERIESEQGIIRKIPIVGSVWNWWSPNNQILRGNSFNLITTKLSEPKPYIKKPTFESSDSIADRKLSTSPGALEIARPTRKISVSGPDPVNHHHPLNNNNNDEKQIVTQY